MRLRPTPWLLTALVMAVAAMATGGTGVPPAGAQPARPPGGVDPLPAVQALLADRAAALGAGDRARWLATVDPLAPPSFRDAQGRSFDGLRSIPLDRYGLLARTDDTGDLAAGAGLSARYGGAPTFLPETRQVLRFAGFDDRDAVDVMWWTYVQRDGRWYVGGDRDLADLGLESTQSLWDLGPVVTRSSEHFLVLHHPEQAARADALAVMAEEAHAAFAGRWDKPWSGRIPMILPASVAELETMLQSTIDLTKFVAFVAYGIVRDQSFEATAPRIYIQDANLSRASRKFQVETLAHELSHAAAVPLLGPQIPIWVHEGLADWIGTGRSTKESKPRGVPVTLPRDEQFSTGSQRAIGAAYTASRTAMSRLARDHGLGAPTALFAAVGEQRVAAGSPDFHVDSAIRRLFGLSIEEFQSKWASGR